MSDIDGLFAREFPVESQCVYLNHAAVAPWPLRTGQAVTRFATECVEMGAAAYPAWVETENRLRARLANLINAHGPEDIGLVKNTSEGLSMIAQGFPWKKGDQVVICAEEFPSNRIVWESLASYGVTVKRVPLQGVQDPEATLIKAMGKRTRLLAISTVQYGTGLRVDLTRLGEHCRANAIVFCVDAIQGLGILPHDVQAMHIDFLVADAHKWLLGPEGIAVFYSSAHWRAQLKLFEYGWHMTEDAMNFDRQDWQPADSARRFECGSPNMLGIHAFSASLSLFEEIGVDEIARRVQRNAEELFTLIAEQPALELLTDRAPNRYAGIVTFRHKHVENEQLFQHLRSQRVVCALRGGGIRFSAHAYTRKTSLQQAVELTNI